MQSHKEPVPFKIQVDEAPFIIREAEKFDGKDVEFPYLRNVLWNRKAIGKTVTIDIWKTQNRKLQLILSRKALGLAYSQLEVYDKEEFFGYFAGYVNFSEEDQEQCIQVILDRFDPGRYCQSEKLLENNKIPTASLPGDLCVPVSLQHGMAYVNHKSTETFTSVDFTKSFYVLKSVLSRNEKIELNHFLNMKMKCCFVTADDEVLAYISAGAVSFSTYFEMTPVNSLPIIQTALARNLEENLSLSESQINIKTGYITLDQTRKLLLLLDSDPKVAKLPLVGVWISGVDNVEDSHVWCQCMRFLFNDAIYERVHAPPKNYLLVVFSPISANPLFYEFYHKSSNESEENEVDFELVQMCEGIQLQYPNSNHVDEDDVHFDLVVETCGMLRNNFNDALQRFTGKRQSANQQFSPGRHHQSMDDSIPKISDVLSPHPQVASIPTPSSLDISICESITQEPSHHSQRTIQNDKQNTNIKKPTHDLRFPRPTKSSLIRMNLNRPTINKTQNPKGITKSIKSKEKEHVTEKLNLKEIDLFFAEENLKLRKENQTEDEHDESIPRIPVGLRNHLSEKSKTDKSLSVVLEPTYCPENYSDFDEERFEVEESFHIPDNDNVQEEEKDREEINGEEENDELNIEEIVDKNEKEKMKDNKDEIYKLIFEQQNQLAALQKQLQVFLNHQENREIQPPKEKEGKSNEENENEILKKKQEILEEQQSNEIRNMQITQQKQLQDLQQQVQLFLQQTATPNFSKEAPKSDTSVQCSPPSPPLRNSIGVNTGRSLLWPTENLAITKSDTALRGTQQAVAPNDSKSNEKKKNRKWCKCCQHCDNKSSNGRKPARTESTMSSQLSQSQTIDEVSTLSDMQSQDIPFINDTANSNQTFSSSLQGVDLPVFEGTCEQEREEISETPIKTKSNNEQWDKSPELGESASVLQHQKQVENEAETNILNNKEFYQQMMSQVQKLIDAQSDKDVDDEPTEYSEDDEQFIKPPPQMTQREKLERVRDATAKELQKLTCKPNEEEDRIERQRSMSEITPHHPKVNYVSMSSVDDTFYDNTLSNVNNIAAKYLPKDMLHQEYRNNKTVKFEGVYEWQSSSRAGGSNKNNMTSVNFSCNMSIASRKYLQKYELVSGDERLPLKEQNRTLDKKSKKEESIEGKENQILDLKKLRSLQKLT